MHCHCSECAHGVVWNHVERVAMLRFEEVELSAELPHGDQRGDDGHVDACNDDEPEHWKGVVEPRRLLVTARKRLRDDDGRVRDEQKGLRNEQPRNPLDCEKILLVQPSSKRFGPTQDSKFRCRSGSAGFHAGNDREKRCVRPGRCAVELEQLDRVLVHHHLSKTWRNSTLSLVIWQLDRPVAIPSPDVSYLEAHVNKSPS